MKLIGYVLQGQEVDIRPAPAERDWMERTDQRYAYRCLPLTIANACGWELLCRESFTAIWDGENGIDGIKIAVKGGGRCSAISHFGHGILTFHIGCIFRTEPGYDLMVQGPINRPKDAIAPLSGIIETDWSPYTFTMNWLFTHPEIEIEFEKGEPFCSLFPVRRGELETVEPELRSITSDPQLNEQFSAWSKSRLEFNSDLKESGSLAQKQKWQKAYHRGINPDGTPGAEDSHRTRTRLRPFRPLPEK